MGWTKLGLFVGGMAAAAALKVIGGIPQVRRAAVEGVATALEINDSVQKVTQDIMDEAEDVRAEAARQRKIDAGVAERLATLEEGIREEVTAEVDGTVKKASKAKK